MQTALLVLWIRPARNEQEPSLIVDAEVLPTMPRLNMNQLFVERGLPCCVLELSAPTYLQAKAAMIEAVLKSGSFAFVKKAPSFARMMNEQIVTG